MKLPWFGPYTIGRRDEAKYPNSYIIILDDGKEVVINEKNIKYFFDRPAWMKKLFHTTSPLVIDSEDRIEPHKEGEMIVELDPTPLVPEMEVEVSKEIPKELEKTTDKKVKGKTPRPGVRQSERINEKAQQWNPQPGDKVDVKFYYRGRTGWCCGSIKEINPGNRKIYVE